MAEGEQVSRYWTTAGTSWLASGIKVNIHTIPNWEGNKFGPNVCDCSSCKMFWEERVHILSG